MSHELYVMPHRITIRCGCMSLIFVSESYVIVQYLMIENQVNLILGFIYIGMKNERCFFLKKSKEKGDGMKRAVTILIFRQHGDNNSVDSYI